MFLRQPTSRMPRSPSMAIPTYRAFLDTYQRTGDFQSLQKCLPSSSMRHPDTLDQDSADTFCEAFIEHFQYAGSSKNIEAAIMLPCSHHRPRTLALKTIALASRAMFNTKDDTVQLQTAFAQLPSYVANLKDAAWCLRARTAALTVISVRLGHLDLCDEGVRSARSALVLGALCDGDINADRYEVTMSLARLLHFRLGIELTQDALDLASRELELLLPQVLTNPLRLTFTRYWQACFTLKQGLLSSLDLVGIHKVRAAEACNTLGQLPLHHAMRAQVLTALCISLGTLFSLTGRFRILDELSHLAITEREAACQEGCLARNMAQAMVRRVSLGRARAPSPAMKRLLQQAVELLEHMLTMHLAPNAQRTVLLLGLCAAMQVQYKVGLVYDVEYDIERAREARSLPMIDDRMMVESIERLAGALLRRARVRGCRESVLEAMSILDEALSLGKIQGRGQGDSEMELLCLRAECDVQMALFDGIPNAERERLLENAWNAFANLQDPHRVPTHSLIHCADAAIRWAAAAESVSAKDVALRAYRLTLDMLPHLTSGDVSSRIALLRNAEGVAHRAAAILSSKHEYVKGLEYLEKGRGVIWAQTIRGRGGGPWNHQHPASQSPHDLRVDVMDIAELLKTWYGPDTGLASIPDGSHDAFVVVVTPGEDASSAHVLILHHCYGEYGAEPRYLCLALDFLKMRLMLRGAMMSNARARRDHDPTSDANLTRKITLVRDQNGSRCTQQSPMETLLAELWTSLVKPVLDCVKSRQLVSTVTLRRSVDSGNQVLTMNEPLRL
jgi:hypothetical protein